MHDEHCVASHALRVTLQLAERAVMQAQLRQHFTRLEPEVAQHEIALLYWRRFGRLTRGGCEEGEQECGSIGSCRAPGRGG